MTAAGTRRAQEIEVPDPCARCGSRLRYRRTRPGAQAPGACSQCTRQRAIKRRDLLLAFSGINAVGEAGGGSD